MRKVMLSAVCLALAIAATAVGQMPRAVVTGPKESSTGDMIVLDASASEGLSRVWLLAVSPVPKSFLPVDSGVRCVFATGTPGKYVFVLVVAGTNPNGGAAVEMATHEITVKGNVPDNPQPPPSTPPPDPVTTKVDRVTYVYEKDATAVPRAVAAALSAINAQSLGITASEFEKDSTTGAGGVPAQYRVALDAAKRAGLPVLVVQSGDQVIRVVKDPRTEEAITEAIR